MKSFALRLLFALIIAGAAPLMSAAENLNAVKARIEQRLGAVNALKDKGVVGESNRGFLEARGAASADDQGVISQENADRRTVYADIAAKTGASADAVGRQRAQQLAGLARPGHWIQDSGGAWKTK